MSTIHDTRHTVLIGKEKLEGGRESASSVYPPWALGSFLLFPSDCTVQYHACTRRERTKTTGRREEGGYDWEGEIPIGMWSSRDALFGSVGVGLGRASGVPRMNE